MSSPSRINNESGYSLIIAILAIALIAILGASMLLISSNMIKTTVNERDDQSVYYIAEAGLAETRAEINALATKAFNDVDKQYGKITDPEEKEAFLQEKSFEERFLEAAKIYIANYITVSQSENNFDKQYDKQFDGNNLPTAKVKVIPDKNKDYTYEITSKGNLDGKSRTVSQVVTVVFGHEVENEEIIIGGSPPPGSGLFKACANGYFNSALTSGTVKFEGDIILKEDSTLNLGGNGGIGGNVYSYGNLSITNSAPISGGVYSNGFVKLLNAMKVGGHVLALGDIEFNNTAEVAGNVFSNSGVIISNNPIIKGQLYATGVINITGQPKVTGDIVSNNTITLWNGQIKAREILSSRTVNVKGGTYSNIRQNVTIAELPKPINGFGGLIEMSKLYKDSDCTNLVDENFKPKMPDIKFQKTSSNLAKEVQSVKFTDLNREMHFNEFKPVNQWNNPTAITIELPSSSEGTVYKLYVNDLDMKNLDITISGNGKLNIYVRDSLVLGKVIQDKDSGGKKRSNFDTTIYYLNDNKKSLDLSTWGSCKIEANLYVKNADLKNNGCTVNGNIVVLGNNTVTLNGNNTTNGQIFYLPSSDLIAAGSVKIKGSIVAKNMSGSGNVTISNPTTGEGSIDTDIFDKPSSTFEIKNYKAETLLLTEQQKEK